MRAFPKRALLRRGARLFSPFLSRSPCLEYLGMLDRRLFLTVQRHALEKIYGLAPQGGEMAIARLENGIRAVRY